MRPIHFGPFALLLCFVFSAGGNTPLLAQIQLATDDAKPLSPEESRKLFKLPAGFRVELVAAEPLVADPVAIAFDARGRLFVCEIHGYNLEGYYDVLELNKTGELDRVVRRILASPEATRRAEQEQYGTVKLLEDTDGDGHMDRMAVWADRLPPCYGVAPALDGAIVLCAPDIVYLADRDGDGRAEVRETLFTGFGVGELWTRINSPRWGVDNWIYGVCGASSGGTIRGPKLAKEVELGAVCFRFKPDGSALEPCSGRTSGFGQAMTDWGERFLVTNQQHALFVAPLEHRYLARNPFYAAPNPVVNVSTYGHPARVYPTSQPDPWRLARSKDPAWVKFYGAAEATANGFFTAASGQAIYQAAQFPAEYRGNHFSVDNAQNLIHRCLLERSGASYAVRRPKADEETEFLTTPEQWFRPVNLSVGPDGGLVVVDMYRAIIEDYSAIPRFLQQLYIESLVAGADRGRIWRIVAGGPVGPRRLDLTKATAAELVAKLADPNAWWRRTAQRVLVERGDRSAAGPLVFLAKTGETPQARLHALYALEGLGSLDPAVVEHALGDPHYGVRVHALRLAERWLAASPDLLAKAAALADDPDPSVRLQAGFTLGETKAPRAVAALARLAAAHGGDPWIQAAILSSSADTADGLLASILAQGERAAEARRLIRPLASVVGARRDEAQLGALLEALAGVTAGDSAALATEALRGLVEGLGRGKAVALGSDKGRLALRRLLISPSQETRELALQAARLLKLADTPELMAAYQTAARVARDAARSVEDRQAAVATLAAAPYAVLAPAAKELLDPRQPLDLQLAAVGALSLGEDPAVGSVLLTGFNRFTPKLQAAALDAVFARQNRLPKLLDAIENRTVPVSGLDAFRRLQLEENADPDIRRRAKALLAGATKADRKDLVARYQAALKDPRDPVRGKKVFQEQCAKCHKLAGEGFEVGPDLSSVLSRPDDTLVSDVMDPNNQITVGFRKYVVTTEDGRIFDGVLAAETATSVTLRKEEGKEETILRKDIDEMEASSISMMPEDLEKQVQPKDVADLIAYLRQALGPAAPPSITLFDDNPRFADLLAEGEGRARIVTEGAFAGRACLAVTPPQRWSLEIPGWRYTIAEKPGPGEFRYLRFAWKSRGGQGVMIELAADGQWPPGDRPLRRYYAGKNTTGWAAVSVADRAPGEWVVVTRDLWKDFGAFTLTGIAPTAMGGEALFDKIELLRTLDGVSR